MYGLKITPIITILRLIPNLYVGFVDFGGYGDNSGTITFKLYEVYGDYNISII